MGDRSGTRRQLGGFPTGRNLLAGKAFTVIRWSVSRSPNSSKAASLMQPAPSPMADIGNLDIYDVQAPTERFADAQEFKCGKIPYLSEQLLQFSCELPK